MAELFVMNVNYVLLHMCLKLSIFLLGLLVNINVHLYCI